MTQSYYYERVVVFIIDYANINYQTTVKV